MSIKPLKKFGQNYLVDKNIVRKMLNSLDINFSDSILEIGPGKGFITTEISPLVEKFTAIEIDTRVIDELQNKFENLKIINKDITKFDFNDLENETPFKIVGNIPFNLTGEILFKLLYNKYLVREAILIIPLDIAKRLIANKRTKEYGALTVIFRYFSTVKLISKLSKNVFYPKPNIEAAIIHIKFDKKTSPEVDDNLFIKVVKSSFGNRRKTLNNSLRNSIFANCDFSSIDISFSQRAEELEVPDFILLTKFIQKQDGFTE